ncbi:MAG TPA: single-stranded DNA-binding protein [Acidobacteriota bacterium]|nr:single-stranded DNA-binding protein [Acidobacteriota bacterium]
MVNRVFLIGRLGRDPELRYTGSGTPVANFSLATDETWTDANGQRQNRTEWHNIVVWSRLAEICHQYLRKGRLVFIEGRIQTREWDDRDGNKRRTTEIVATNMQMLESRSDQGQSGSGAQEERMDAMEIGISDDDIPF